MTKKQTRKRVVDPGPGKVITVADLTRWAHRFKTEEERKVFTALFLRMRQGLRHARDLELISREMAWIMSNVVDRLTRDALVLWLSNERRRHDSALCEEIDWVQKRRTMYLAQFAAADRLVTEHEDSWLQLSPHVQPR